MVIKFTDSLMEAIEVASHLLEGRYESATSPKPSWQHFVFFNEIHASPVKMMNYTDSTYCFDRRVDFFHTEMVLTVHLIGYSCRPKGIHPTWVPERLDYCTPYLLPLDPKSNWDFRVEEDEKKRATVIRWYTVNVNDRNKWWKFCEETR